MRSALVRLGDGLSAAGIVFNTERRVYPNQKLHAVFSLEDTPYLARGYSDSYVGVKMPARVTAAAALRDAAAVMPIVVEVAESTWDPPAP